MRTLTTIGRWRKDLENQMLIPTAASIKSTSRRKEQDTTVAEKVCSNRKNITITFADISTKNASTKDFVNLTPGGQWIAGTLIVLALLRTNIRQATITTMIILIQQIIPKI